MSFYIDQTPNGANLVLTGEWAAQAEQCVRRGEATGLVLNYARGFRERSLEFLTGLPLMRLDILARTISDIDPIYSLSETLQELHLDVDSRVEVDLRALPKLVSLSADWGQFKSTLEYAIGLERLFATSYAESTLRPVAVLQHLRSLRLKERPKVETLDGLEALRWLSDLAVFSAPQLRNISALADARSPVLETLELEGCSRVYDVGDVGSCVGLTYLNLSECGDIDSLKPLGSLASLEAFYAYGNTRIANGDLAPLLQLPRLRDFRMQSRRGYSPSVKQIQSVVASRSKAAG